MATVTDLTATVTGNRVDFTWVLNDLPEGVTFADAMVISPQAVNDPGLAIGTATATSQVWLDVADGVYAAVVYVSLSDGSTIVSDPVPFIIGGTTPEPSALTAAVAYVTRHADTTTAPSLTEEEVTAIVEQVPLRDSEGRAPTDEAWEPTYWADRAVALAWALRAGRAATWVDASGEGTSIAASQAVAALERQAARWHAKSIRWGQVSS